MAARFGMRMSGSESGNKSQEKAVSRGATSSNNLDLSLESWGKS